MKHNPINLVAVNVLVALAGLDRLVSDRRTPQRRDERGLSQSTENAILLAGAAAIAIMIITVITAYVKNRLPK